jgi:hypothetical protein
MDLDLTGRIARVSAVHEDTVTAELRGCDDGAVRRAGLPW